MNLPTQNEWLKQKRERELKSPTIKRESSACRKAEDIKILKEDDYSLESLFSELERENAA